MHTRRFGRLGWQVGEIGCGMWGMAGWTGRDDDASRAAACCGIQLHQRAIHPAGAEIADQRRRLGMQVLTVINVRRAA